MARQRHGFLLKRDGGRHSRIARVYTSSKHSQTLKESNPLERPNRLSFVVKFPQKVAVCLRCSYLGLPYLWVGGTVLEVIGRA